MYKYKFVRIKLKSGMFKVKPEKNYQEIIKAHAQKGWRFKQLISPGLSGYGVASYFELIFEKEA